MEPLASLHFAEQFHQAEDRVGRGAAVQAGVQIAIGAAGFHFHVDQAAQTDAQGRKAFGVELRVGDQRDIGLELGWIFRDELADGCAADLFFAFDQELQIDGQLARCTARSASTALMCMYIWPLSSDEPRA